MGGPKKSEELLDRKGEKLLTTSSKNWSSTQNRGQKARRRYKKERPMTGSSKRDFLWKYGKSLARSKKRRLRDELGATRGGAIRKRSVMGGKVSS